MKSIMRTSAWLTAVVLSIGGIACGSGGGETSDQPMARQQSASETAEGVDAVVDTSAAAMKSADITVALIGDDRVDASDIDVTTNQETMTVTLTGTVSSDDEKAAAEEVARAQATEYAVKNDLTVDTDG